MQRAWGPGTWFLFALPPLVLAIWALFYLAQWSDYFREPLKDIEFSYEGQKGRVLGHAETALVDFRSGRVTAQGVSVDLGSFGRLASAQEVEAIIPLPWNLQSNYSVHLSAADLHLRRDETGAWNFQDATPKPSRPGPSTIAYEIGADSVHVRFQDNFVDPKRLWVGTVADVRVAGAGDDADIRGDIALRDVGAGRASLVIANNRLSYMRLASLDVNALPLAAYVSSWPQYRHTDWASSWRATSAAYKGDFIVTNLNGYRVSGKGVADARDFRYSTYPLADIRFAGAFDSDKAQGNINARGHGITADGRGAFAFANRQGWFDGVAYAENDRALRALRLFDVPAKLRFKQGQFSGFASWTKRAGINGRVAAQYFAYGNNEGRNVRGLVVGDDKALRFSGVNAQVLGANASADGVIQLGNTPRVTGEAYASNLDLTRVPNLLEEYVKGGRFNLKVLFAGPVDNIQATVRAQGNALVAMRDETSSHLESFDFALTGTLLGKSFRVDAATANGRAGSLQGTGTVTIDGSRMDLRVSADSIDLDVIPRADLGGIGFADMHVLGSTAKPSMRGLVEVYAASFGDVSVPFVSAQTSMQGKNLSFSDIVGRNGVSLITGDARLHLGKEVDLEGSGKVDDLGLGDLTSNVIEGLAAGTWRLSGTLESPVVDAELAASEAIVDKIEVQEATAKGRWAKGSMQLERFTASVGNGRVEGSGTWSPTGNSEINAKLQGIGAAVLSPYLQDAVTIGGVIDGSGSVHFQEGKLANGASDVSLKDVSINGEAIGSGFITALFSGTTVTATGAIGSLDDYYVLDNLTFDWEKKTLAASMSTLEANLQDSLAVIRAAAKDRISADTAAEIAKLEGKYALKADVALSIHADDELWHFDGGKASLGTSPLTYGGDNIGALTAEISKNGSKYSIPVLSWTGGPATLRLIGGDANFITEDGPVNLDGELGNIDLTWLGKFDSRFTGLKGNVDTSFSVIGTSAAPEITTTLNGRDISYNEFSADTFWLGPIFIKDSLISGTAGSDVGKVAVRGFEARLTELKLPYKYPFEIPGDQLLSAKVVVPSRDINDLSKFFGGLDAEHTKGTLKGGEFVVGGTRDHLETKGSLELSAETLKFTDFDTALRNVFAKVTLDNSTVDVSVKADSAMGGKADLKTGVSLQDRSLTEASYFKLDNFGFSYQLGPQSRARGVLSSDLQLSGDAMEPLITGTVRGTDASLSLAGELFNRAPGQAMLLNPYFDIALELMGGTVSSSLLQAKIKGLGKLQGPLNQADLSVDFAVDEGEITLPTGRVRIERGGKAAFKYGTDYRGETKATLNIDINANTRVTADAGFGPQRYLISLHITGDLLSDEDLNIEAESDPPDLSRAQILSILGQQKLFEDVVAAGTSGDFGSQVKNLLTSVLAPAVLGQFTRSLERTFGLEYIGLDFSPSGFGGVTLAKALGSGFTLEYRRVVEQFALAGEPLEEIRLSYRPLTSDPLLGRLKFSVSADRLGVIKVTLGYTRRF